MLRFFKDSHIEECTYTSQDFVFRLTKLIKLTAKESQDALLVVCG